MTEEAKRDGWNVKSLTKLLVGVIVVLAGILLTINFFHALRVVVAGCIGPFFILVGLVIVAIAKE